MILKDLRFDFHGHFENQILNQITTFQCDFKNIKILLKWFKIRFSKIVNQIVEYPANMSTPRCTAGAKRDRMTPPAAVAAAAAVAADGLVLFEFRPFVRLLLLLLDGFLGCSSSFAAAAAARLRARQRFW
jgi:hypothetical protein